MTVKISAIAAALVDDLGDLRWSEHVLKDHGGLPSPAFLREQKPTIMA